MLDYKTLLSKNSGGVGLCFMMTGNILLETSDTQGISKRRVWLPEVLRLAAVQRHPASVQGHPPTS